MLDSAEDILREEGYGALTSRRVAERLGVKQRLVYYYFRTMDDLIAETFRRLATRELERLAKALSGTFPLREIWDVCIHTHDARMVAEFMALANRSDSLRKEVVNYIEESRRMQVDALKKAMPAAEAEGHLSPIALVIFATSAALTLHRESGIGVRMGHDQVLRLISRYIEQWEGARVVRKVGRATRSRRSTCHTPRCLAAPQKKIAEISHLKNRENVASSQRIAPSRRSKRVATKR
jgi:AcrR family transcriptional regulator